ncbi:MAG: BMP family ABC transporter substrate-binding protein [Clostridia bacterium]|nr:BMP family ABC transporter substrate-binding protein [Clostridia bacterium]
MKKKLFGVVALALAVVMMAACLGGCGNNAGSKSEIKLPAYDGITEQKVTGEIPATFKVGLICLHDKNSTYDKNFIAAMESVQQELGLTNEQVIIATGIPEGAECKDKAVEMAEAGCQVIIADSFGHEQYMIEAAKQYPNVLFAHATGTKAHMNTDLPNYVNAFASIYEGRYIAGVVAGMKLKEMIDSGKITEDKAKVGYVGAFTYAEVISGYTSWFLGVRSVVPSATMEVTFTGSWYDETAENNAAKKLISNGCVLLSQHADSMGAPNACEEAGVPNVSYNGSTYAAAPNTFLVSSRINWAPYYKYLIDCKINNKTAMKDYTGTIKTGSVELTDLGSAVAEGTLDKVIEVRKALADGTLKVFDTAKFTVEGKKLDSYLADVDDMGDYVGETEAIADGYFHESEKRSAPYFDLTIDGITLLDKNFG